MFDNKKFCREITVAKNEDMISVFIKPCKKKKKRKKNGKK